MINNFCSTLHPCAASAATAGGAGGVCARAAGGAGGSAAARAAGRAGGARAAAAGGVFPKIKAHPTDLGGATQERAYPAAIARQAVAKQSKHQARRRRAGQQPAQQGITIL